MSRAPDYPVPALEKGLDIIEALAAASVPQSLAQLATTLQRSSSELFRMLNCLERRGYLVREELSGKYGLSLKLFAVAHTHSVVDKLLQAARRPMQEWTAKFRESCHLSVLERGQLLVVAEEDSPERVRLSIEVGGRFDPWQTTSGRLLLAQLPDADRVQAIQDVATSAARQRQHEKVLAEIRAAGVSTAKSETIEGVHDVAVLVGAAGTHLVAALATTRLEHRGRRRDEAAMRAGLRSTADEITRALGLSA
jgi:DNA-binding IclR family transcriptional regulator